MKKKTQNTLLFAGPLLLIGWAMLVNPWTLAYLFTADHKIDSQQTAFLMGWLAAALVVGAILSVALRNSRLRPLLMLCHGSLLLATPVLLWGYWLANPLSHHWQRPLSPHEAIARMEVPEGFMIELVAGEPDLVNPVAMTFDERGRIWVTESVEYPRNSPGKGRDRIKILEDTTGDGRADRIVVFADGLNVPSGIAVGHGGTWVLNAPDLLLFKDTDDDGRADEREVVLTGFGRHDAHEFPNSLTWGPDGWLYGLNGIANPSHIKHQGREHRFSCAMFRIHPRTRKFQIFAEGTSNPWGIAWNEDGSAFVSACVIDHLWHLTETGQYVNQSGHYPAFAWPIPSIVDHVHQASAYCGLEYFDSDAYPERYRGKLYMGNINGGAINVDRLERDGATYIAQPDPDLLVANDGWFMPVSVKTGPDGCLYVLDWYDRYHCFQDAQRDPEGIDRGKGRLYRLRYAGTPRVYGFNLGVEDDATLIVHLSDPNIYFRATAQRLLSERLASRQDGPTRARLRELVLAVDTPHWQRMHALWSLIGSGRLDAGFHGQLLAHDNWRLRAWGVRAAGDLPEISAEVAGQIASLTTDLDPAVQVQTAIAAGKLDGDDALDRLVDVLSEGAADKLLPHIVWQNLHPLLATRGREFFAEVEKIRDRSTSESSLANLNAILPRAMERMLVGDSGAEAMSEVLTSMLTGKSGDTETIRKALRTVAGKIQSREIQGGRLATIRRRLEPPLKPILDQGESDPLYFEAAILTASWGDDSTIDVVRSILLDGAEPQGRRILALRALVAAPDEQLAKAANELLSRSASETPEMLGRVIEVLGRADEAPIGNVVLDHLNTLPQGVQSQALDLVTQRPAWARQLLSAIDAGKIDANRLDITQVQQLAALPDREIAKQISARWGKVRLTRDPQRRRVIGEMRKLLEEKKGDPARGRHVFARTCSQCHRLFGQGHDVGPDLTQNGRATREQLLSNVFDPNLVVGKAYHTRVVVTDRGRVLTGLLVEDSQHRVVLKLPGGRREIIPRAEIEDITDPQISLMPEGVERQLTPQDIADLFAYLLQ